MRARLDGPVGPTTVEGVSPRVRLLFAGVCALAAVGVVALSGRGGVEVLPAPEAPPLAPGPWAPDAWQELLGGDSEPTPERWRELEAYTDVDPAGASELRALAGQSVTARFTGRGAQGPAEVVAGTGGSSSTNVTLEGTCSSVTVLAASPVRFPAPQPPGGGGEYAKVAVAWTGECSGSGSPAPGEALVDYVYARQEAGKWQEVTESQVPGSGARWLSVDRRPADLVAPVCGNDSGELLAADVAGAWDAMCAAASDDGVALYIVDGWRSSEEQRARFDAAVDQVGPERARRWVVAPDERGRCLSRHCDGAAVDVAGDGALAWLDGAVACSLGATLAPVPGNGACPQGASPVPRHLRYGFVRPYPHIPEHLQWGLPTPSEQRSGCAVVTGEPGALVAARWRCELARAGVPDAEIVQTAAQAVAQARCASGLNPGAVSQAGRYRERPDPRTGVADTGAGVHQLDRERAERYVPGGYDQVLDVSDSATGAARWWLDNRRAGLDGFSGFVCEQAAGAPSAEDARW